MVIIVIDVWDITIPELTGQENRKLYIYLPNSYNEKTDEYYPVLYMFDGQNVFFDSDATYGKSWGLKEYLEYTNTQMIVVAPACNQNPDNGRLKEYTPYPFKDKTFGNIKSLGKITMDWFVNELKPTIDNTFRTLSDRHCSLYGLWYRRTSTIQTYDTKICDDIVYVNEKKYQIKFSHCAKWYS